MILAQVQLGQVLEAVEAAGCELLGAVFAQVEAPQTPEQTAGKVVELDRLQTRLGQIERDLARVAEFKQVVVFVLVVVVVGQFVFNERANANVIRRRDFLEEEEETEARWSLVVSSTALLCVLSMLSSFTAFCI